MNLNKVIKASIKEALEDWYIEGKAGDIVTLRDDLTKDGVFYPAGLTGTLIKDSNFTSGGEMVWVEWDEVDYPDVMLAIGQVKKKED